MTALLANWVLTASLLTAAVLLLRAAFGRRISARLRYALWLTVLARLLLPGQLFTAPVETPRVLPEVPAIQTLPGGHLFPEQARPAAPGGEGGAPVPASPTPMEEGESAAPEAKKTVHPLNLLGGVWLAGSAAMAAVFLGANLRFYRKLRRVRAPLEADCPRPVYVVSGLPSPCLFGIPRPSVYVTPEAANPAALRHVLAHETTHYRQGDHIWSALRCAALAVHWWNPLVWLAAVYSRRDAELACDEGTLKILGDGERRAYGGTLLALVTAKPQPGDLLRCATTMTGDKRSLRERVGRIARAPKRWLWAAVVSVALAALVCACSFAKTETPEAEDRPLTAEELERFNTEVFNGDSPNILNQFLLLAVEAPKDYRQIDLFQLFYNASEPYTEEERQAVADAGYEGDDPQLDLTKCTASQMNEVLETYLGLTLEETDRWGLDQFTYLPEYDAYYFFHGDTNSIGPVTFTSGEYRDGNILLYYEGDGYPCLSRGDGSLIYWDGVKQFCLTLEPQKDGGFHFLTNWECDPPAVPTAYPDWDPELVIPLDGLAPYGPEEVTVERRSDKIVESLYRARFEPDEFSDGSFDVEVYRSAGGDAYASVVVSETERDCFLTIPALDTRNWPFTDFAETFTDLFGQSGFAISYYGWLDEHYYGTFYDYYTFTKDGVPSLLLRAKGETADVDLDGDGIYELTASGGSDGPQLFFQRDGRLYLAEIDALVHEAWPEAGYTDYGFWGEDTRRMPLCAQVPLSGGESSASAFRMLWFDGENLRLYKDGSIYADRIKMGIDAPADVIRQAALFVDTQFHLLAADGYGTDGSGNYDEENFGPGNVAWEDWHITDLTGPYYETAGNIRVEIWNVSYETYTPTPERVVAAGGSYVGEDGWCMIGYPGCDYLYFRLDEDGNRTFLYSTMENDCSPGSELFLSDMVRALTDQGLLGLTDLDGETLAKIMWPQSAYFLNTLAERDEAERDEILLFLAGYLSNGGEQGKAYYDGFCHELDGDGFRAGELTDGGRAAWEKVRDFVNGFAESRETAKLGDRQGREESAQILHSMSFPELFEAYRYEKQEEPHATYSLLVMTELLERFQKDARGFLSALADGEQPPELADDLGASLYLNRAVFPDALEQAKALTGLEEAQAAVRDRILSAYEAKEQESTAG